MMRDLNVSIEIRGEQVHAGVISGEDASAACFSYAAEYLESARPAISVSLPLQEEAFSARQTKNFFEGLLPEGFTRRSVAEWMRTDEEDYIRILAGLGRECLGALRITEEGAPPVTSSYERLSPARVHALAAEGAVRSAELVTASHVSLTGASGKVGLYYDPAADVWYLPVGDAPGTHIVKQSHVRLEKIVANEQLCMMTARALGIPVPECFIVDTGRGKDEDVLFASSRYDRKLSPEGRMIGDIRSPLRLHQEDFSQALGIPASRKYEHDDEGYLPGMFGLLRDRSARPLEDRNRLWDMLVLDFLIGNTDSHIKNFSLLYTEDLSSVRLAPAYDILSTVIYESSTKDMAFNIGGRTDIRELDRSAFAEAADECGLGVRAALRRNKSMRCCSVMLCVR